MTIFLDTTSFQNRALYEQGLKKRKNFRPLAWTQQYMNIHRPDRWTGEFIIIFWINQYRKKCSGWYTPLHNLNIFCKINVIGYKKKHQECLGCCPSRFQSNRQSKIVFLNVGYSIAGLRLIIFGSQIHLVIICTNRCCWSIPSIISRLWQAHSQICNSDSF